MSDTDRWLRIKQLFAEAQSVAAVERDAWLEQTCAGDAEVASEMRGLLDAQQSTGNLLDAAADDVLRRIGEPAQHVDASGMQIGPYRLVRLIGEGGMGSVYLAERGDVEFRQRVALKLVRPDFVNTALRERFLRERNFLARLVHPHIAQLHDGGVSADGTPYFTLEYVDGEPITKYCDARNLDVRSRVGLLVQVCAAVAYAHRNLIVHRDLKPSNILITAEGEAKLLDFGIAKFLDADAGAGATATQARMMTPEYAAPEQVLGGPITTATDVYAIGVLLYELLSGRPPYARADAGTISWPQAVVEEMPEPLARALSRTLPGRDRPTGERIAAARSSNVTALRRALRGDLDRIVRRALAKDAESRYASINDLAEDLRAFAAGRAISGGSRRYRLRMFVRRHWLPLGAAAAIVLLLIGGSAAIVWQSRQIVHEAQNTLQVKNFLLGLFTAVDPREAKGREVSARELLDRGAERIDRHKALDPEQRAEIESTLGRIYYQLGLYDQADTLQSGAIAVLSAMPSQVLKLARAQVERSDTLDARGDLKRAAELAEHASVTLRDLPEATVEDRTRAAHSRARVAIDQRDFAKAREFSEAEIALARQAATTDSALLFGALMTSGAASWGLAQPERAEVTWREAVAVAERDGRELDVAKGRGNLGMALQRESRYAEAKAVEEQSLAAYEKALGPDHAFTMGVRADLALSNYHLGHYAAARTMMEQVVAAERKRLGNDHPAIAGTEINLGLLLVDSGDAAAAERVLTEAVAIFEKRYGRDYEGVRIALGGLALAHAALGQLDKAQSEFEEVIARANKPGTGESGGFVDRYRLGDVKRLQGDLPGAIELQRAALAASRKEYGENSRYTATAHQYLALSLRDSGDDAGAAGEFRAALAAYASYLPNAEHPLAATTRYELALLLLKHDDTRAEALRLLAEAADLREKFLGADDPKTKQARLALSQARAAVKS